MSMIRVAINGFGRIGRAFFRAVHDDPTIDVVAVNDLAKVENLAYLLEYDTAYGQSSFSVSHTTETLSVDGVSIPLLHEHDPSALPWGGMGVDVVIEATGVFRTAEKAGQHITAGAGRVIVTAPLKGDDAEDVATILVGVNESKGGACNISSNASCTTNAVSPLIGILKASVGIEHALLNTVHAYTASQSIVDAPSSDMRRGRAGAQNIIPTSTGAAIATTKAHTDLTNRFDGIALRVPVPVGSIVDVTFTSTSDTTAEAVNEALKTAAASPKWKRIFAVSDKPLVSSDIIGAPYAAIADLPMTRVVGGRLVKVLAWYDNEAGYAYTLKEHVHALSQTAQEEDAHTTEKL